MHDVFLGHHGVPAPLEVGEGHRVGEEEPGELPGQQETPHSFEHLQSFPRYGKCLHVNLRPTDLQFSTLT